MSEFVQIGNAVLQRDEITEVYSDEDDKGRFVRVQLRDGRSWRFPGMAVDDIAALLLRGEGQVALAARYYFVQQHHSEVYHSVPVPRSGPNVALCGYETVWPMRLSTDRADFGRLGVRHCGHCARIEANGA